MGITGILDNYVTQAVTTAALAGLTCVASEEAGECWVLPAVPGSASATSPQATSSAANHRDLN